MKIRLATDKVADAEKAEPKTEKEFLLEELDCMVAFYMDAYDLSKDRKKYVRKIEKLAQKGIAALKVKD
jgi:hypothetical protein